MSYSGQEERFYTCKNSSVKQISSSLADTVYKLREESKLLRKAHQEVHSQLLNAQVVTKGGWWPQGAAVPASYRCGSDFRKHTQVKGIVCLAHVRADNHQDSQLLYQRCVLQSAPSVPSMLLRPSGG